MAMLPRENGQPYRAFVCQTLNEWGFPAKDRSGKLDLLEEPHLGKLLNKMSDNKNVNKKSLEFVNPKEEDNQNG